METIKKSMKKTFIDVEKKSKQSNKENNFPDFSHAAQSFRDIPQSDFLNTPIAAVSVVDKGSAYDDSVIRRVSMGGMASLDVSASTRTTPRRPSDSKYYLCPSNTFVASNGEVYHVDPFQLPPPAEIASLFNEKNQQRVNAKYMKDDSLLYRSNTLPPASLRNVKDNNGSPNKYPSLPAEWMTSPAVSGPGTGTSDTEDDNGMFVFSKFSWKKFLLAEILGIGDPGHLEPNAVEYIDNFLNVPFQLEKLIFFGVFVALDSFLYVITYLPVRFILATLILLDECMHWFIGLRPLAYLSGTVYHSNAAPTSPKRRTFDFPTTRQYDLMRGLLLVIGCYVLHLLNMSRVYHYIRMQNTIKLYVLTSMMEIIDKLLCSFGIDALDSLFWKTRTRAGSTAIIFSFFVTCVYVVIHCGLYFTHLATLTVAINNVDQSLTTVLILNNFAEIKSFVLKKFDRENLFQLSCSDITERFKMTLFYCLIIGVGVVQANNVWDVIPMFSGVLGAMVACEMFVDWIKHAFIAKFNKIDASCYKDYARILRSDILNGHKDKITLDHSYTITKRLGMSQIPLGCVFFRFMSIAWSATGISRHIVRFTSFQLVSIIVVLCMLVVGFKVTLGMCLIYYTGQKNNRERREEIERKRRDELASETYAKKVDDEKKKSIDKLSNIERYTMLKGRIEG